MLFPGVRMTVFLGCFLFYFLARMSTYVGDTCYVMMGEIIFNCLVDMQVFILIFMQDVGVLV